MSFIFRLRYFQIIKQVFVLSAGNTSVKALNTAGGGQQLPIVRGWLVGYTW